MDCAVGVVGGGTMGMGIAQWLARAGCDVVLHSRRREARERFLEGSARYLRRRGRSRKLGPEEVEAQLERIRSTGSYENFDRCDIVIEAVEEDLSTKARVIDDLEGVVAPETTLASTTSSLTIEAIARLSRLPERVVGMHFFNPVSAIRIVELAHTARTAALHRERSSRFVTEIGKLPLHVRDSAFFLVNRILCRPLLEAMRAYTERAATPRQIDESCTAWGMTMGPCAMLDMIGLDAITTGAEGLLEALGEDFRCPELLERAVAEGRCGRKSGRGIYAYDGRTPRPDPRFDEIREDLESTLGRPPRTSFRVERIAVPMVNEALVCLHDGSATARAIDLGLTETICSERGPLRYYLQRGRKAHLKDVDSLCEELGPRFRLPDEVRAFLDSPQAVDLLAGV